MLSSRRALLPVAALLLIVVACGGSRIDVGAGPGDAGSAEPSSRPTGSLLAGMPDRCSLAESGTSQGQAVQAGLEDDVDRGPLVAVPTGDDEGSSIVAATLFDEQDSPGDVAAWRVTGSGAVTAGNELAGTISRFEVEPIDTAGSDPVAQALAIATDCSWGAATRVRPPPPEPEPSMRPGLMVLEPAAVRPGEVVRMHFPEETMRGVAFQLDRRTEPGWETVFWLTSDGNDGQPDWAPVGTDGYAWPDVGVGGPGPDRILIPDGVVPGSYRVCTANAGDEFCAPLEIIQ